MPFDRVRSDLIDGQRASPAYHLKWHSPRTRASNIAITAALLTFSGGVRADDVAQGSMFHADIARTGNYVVPGLTFHAAKTMRRIDEFDGTATGNVNVQPLYWRATGAPNGMIIAATDQNVVQALDSVSGKALWHTKLGQVDQRPVPKCGAPRQQGIYSTPVIDPAHGVLYAVGSVPGETTNGYDMWAVSLMDGSVLPGWPVSLSKAVTDEGNHFVTIVHDQRTALTLWRGLLYAGFAANHGDCGSYHGWLMAVDASSAKLVGSWRAHALKAGVWSTGGVTSDGTSLFAATGNGVEPDGYAGGETVFRFAPQLAQPVSTQNYFAPSDWSALDATDYDLGGSSPLPIDVPLPSGGTAPWLLQIGKGGVAYVLDRTNLGGIGGELAATDVAQAPVVVKSAAYPGLNGITDVFPGIGTHCPGASSPMQGLVAVSVTATPAPSVATRWCVSTGTPGVPSVTTTDGTSDPIVWVATELPSHFLLGFNGDTGRPLYQGGPAADCVAETPSHTAILAAEGRLFVGGRRRVCAFGFTPGR